MAEEDEGERPDLRFLTVVTETATGSFELSGGELTATETDVADKGDTVTTTRCEAGVSVNGVVAAADVEFDTGGATRRDPADTVEREVRPRPREAPERPTAGPLSEDA